MGKVFSKVLFVLLLVSSIAWAQTPSAGQVIITSGPFQAISTSNQARVLTRGSYFYSGETLLTGSNSTAQVKFSDGTIMAFYPNTRIRVDEYSYQQDNKKDKSVVTLVKGGFRALTGAISKKDSSAYAVQTPVAVIGVRGTTYGAVMDKGHLYSGVWDGGIFVQNNKGMINLGQNNMYHFSEVASKNAAPIGLPRAPEQLVGPCGKEVTDELALLCGKKMK